MTVRQNKHVLQLAHSPDPDDAFMWWPLFEVDGQRPAITSERFDFEPVPLDIERLNERSAAGEYEITAMSCAQYPRVQDRYVLTACGASIGDGYGPKLVAREAIQLEELRDSNHPIAVPGDRTSAFGALTLLLGRSDFRYEVVEFDTIIERIADGSFRAGVVIHEGQLTFEAAGLHLIEDLGAWWKRTRGLPLPLGVNAVRRDLDAVAGEGALCEVTTLLQRSVEHALAHRTESLAYAAAFARGIPDAVADRFVELYVNHWTLDFGADGRRAVMQFVGELAAIGLCPAMRKDEFVISAVR